MIVFICTAIGLISGTPFCIAIRRCSFKNITNNVILGTSGTIAGNMLSSNRHELQLTAFEDFDAKVLAYQIVGAFLLLMISDIYRRYGGHY